ncbi:Hypothetical predicted protein [Lecanosticta acicola]|uniref:Peptidase A1 domain-containing protein n=1 Tax=Lecanosticta acicola TaxID=111012 RepID=A0AAI9E4K0_9PEZI|nr:Hypothetical predicted protein [Lecanosticta acicola]
MSARRYTVVVIALLLYVPVIQAVSSGKWLSLSPSWQWDGIDGMWSTFEVEIGDPGQKVRLLPGTSAYTGNVVSVVTPPGCSRYPAAANCTGSRGNVFSSNASSTWSTRGLPDGGESELDDPVESALGSTGSVSYGFDTLRFPCPDVPLVANLLVAEYATEDFWLGSLGLSPVTSNYSGAHVSAPSLLSVLRHRGGIGGLSWAYTAGAYYRQVFGSLTLGGYDASRLDAMKSITVPFASDPSRDLVLGVQSMTYDTPGSTPLGGGFYAFIDSMVSQMWLPASVCERFEQAFNLTWNSTCELYLVTDEAHANLIELNPTVTFTVGGADALADGQTIDIDIPYAAFDLNISAPLVEKSSRYFPLKRANSSSDYTLGRVFLQAAYLFADYDRSEFRVSQALYPESYDRKTLVAVDSPHKAHLGKAEIAGCVVLLVVFAGSCAVFGTTILLRKKRSRVQRQLASSLAEKDAIVDEKADAIHSLSLCSAASTPSVAELSGIETQIHEAQTQDRDRPELSETKRASIRHELPVEVVAVELDGHSCSI